MDFSNFTSQGWSQNYSRANSESILGRSARQLSNMEHYAGYDPGREISCEYDTGGRQLSVLIGYLRRELYNSYPECFVQEAENGKVMRPHNASYSDRRLGSENRAGYRL